MTLSWIDEPSTLGAVRHYRMAPTGFAPTKDVYASPDQVPAFAKQYYDEVVKSHVDYCYKHYALGTTGLKSCMLTFYDVAVTDVLTGHLVGTWKTNVGWVAAPLVVEPPTAAHRPTSPVRTPAGPLSPSVAPSTRAQAPYSPPDYRQLRGVEWVPEPSLGALRPARAPMPATTLRPAVAHPSAPMPMVPGCPPGELWDAADKTCKPSAPAPFTCPPGFVWDSVSKTCKPTSLQAQPTVQPRPGPGPQPMVQPRHGCPPGETRGPDGVCRQLQVPPRTLGVDPLAMQARGLLILWGNTQTIPPVANYGPPQDVSLDWTERDGRMLHAFAQWRNILNWQGDMADQFGVVVAQPDQAHVDALVQWAAEVGAQLPVAQALDAATSRALLGLWGKTDGRAVALDDYGMNPAELAPAWSSRDTTMLKAFQTWWNEQGKSALATDGNLDAASSIALKQWLADALAKVPLGWTNPGAQPQTPATTHPPCGKGFVWDDVNQACQPLPIVPVTTAAPPAAKSSAAWWVLGGVAVVGGLLWYFGRGVGAAVGEPGAMKENPSSRFVAFDTKAEAVSYAEKINGPGGSGSFTSPLAYLHRRKNKWVVEVVDRSRASENPRIPTKNIYWKDITLEDKVQLVGHTYVVTKPSGKKFTAYWISRGGESVEAQKWLKLAAAGWRTNANPTGYYVRVLGGNKETYGPYSTLKRSKTFARIGAQHGKHDRVVVRGGRVVRHYRAGTGESLVHENPISEGQRAYAIAYGKKKDAVRNRDFSFAHEQEIYMRKVASAYRLSADETRKIRGAVDAADIGEEGYGANPKSRFGPPPKRAKRYGREGDVAMFRLKEYLEPGGRYPYDELAGDMESAFMEGLNVVLLSVPEFLMVSAVQVPGEKPWDSRESHKVWCVDMSGRKCYSTAAEAIRK